jgi:hypothetical protein
MDAKKSGRVLIVLAGLNNKNGRLSNGINNRDAVRILQN